MQQQINILFLIALLILTSCDQKESTQTVSNATDSITVYNDVSYAQHGGYDPETTKKFKVIDTACINGNNRAKSDLKKNKYTYYLYTRMGLTIEEGTYIKNAFFNRGINIEYLGSNCVSWPRKEIFKQYCYEKAMNNGFEQKYGRTLIDSIKKAAEIIGQEYTKKNVNN